jgi:hypothetical protein
MQARRHRLQVRSLELWPKLGDETARVTEGNAPGDRYAPPQAVTPRANQRGLRSEG